MGKVDKEQIEKAINACLNEGFSIRKACAAFNVKKTTLADRLSGRSDRIGAPTALSPVVEDFIVEILKTTSDIGFKLNRVEILDIAENFLKNSGQSNLFKNGRPGLEWFNGFMTRHSTKLAPYNIPSNRGSVSDTTAFQLWSERVKQFYDENQLNQKPSHIFHCNEIGMICDNGIDFLYSVNYLKFKHSCP